jgi:hypothetical protein
MRRTGLVLVLSIALTVVACGRQVTFPHYAASGGLPSGWMAARFTVSAPFAFDTYDYIIVFNTTGNGVTPLPNGGSQSNYAGFSDAIVVSGNASGAVNAVPVQFISSSNAPGAVPAVYPLTVPPQDIIFNADYNGTGTEFQIEFDRAIFSNLLSTPTPKPTPTPTPTPIGATPTPVPTASPTPIVSTVWKFNCFVTSQGTTGGSFGGAGNTNYAPVDSLGIGGGSDTSFSSPNLATTTAFNITQNALNASGGPTQSANIVSCEFQNTP